MVTTTTGCSSDNNNDESAVFTVNTTESGASYYIGLPMEIGLLDSPEEIIATGIIGKEGKISFSIDMTPFIGQKVWFCVPKVVKFFHTMTAEEIAEGSLTLPDKEKGCTLLTSKGGSQAGGKYCTNDWIVSLYMGTHKEGHSDVPLYWAAGNIIATKLNAADETTKAAFHLSTIDEMVAQTKDRNFVGSDDRLKVNSMDAFSAFPAGTQWDKFHYGDITGTALYSQRSLFLQNSKQIGVFDISGMKNYDISSAQLGGTWRLPTGGFSEYNELAPFEDDTEEYVNLEPNATEWIVEGVNVGYKYQYEIENNGKIITINTLYFPLAGFRHGRLDTGRGTNGWYWAGTADAQGLPPYNPSSDEAGQPVNKNTNAYTLGFHDKLCDKIVHPRNSFECIRPVTE